MKLHIGKLLVVFLFSLLLLLSGCHTEPQVPLTEEAQRLMDETVNNLISEMHPDNIFLQPLQQHLQITVQSITAGDNNHFFAQCHVTSVDFAQPLISYLSSQDPQGTASTAEIIQNLETIVLQAPVLEKDFTIELIPIERQTAADSKLIPLFTNELIDFCSGNTQALQVYLASLLEGAVS